MTELPIPDPDLVRAARQHLTSRFATGVEAVLWEMHKHPMHDLDAVTRALRDRPEDEQAGTTTMDLGAAFLVLSAARLDVDRLEAALFERALELGLDYEQVAAVLELPDADTARQRHRRMARRAEAPTDERPPPPAGPGSERRVRGELARHRADEAAERARAAGRRRRDLTGSPDVPPAETAETPAETAETAARRAAQAKERTAAARLAEARAHEDAVQRHEAALQAGQGDADEHRRLAEEHREAARAARAAAAGGAPLP
ncbi:hypothetical protein [Actinomadura rubrisoli]|uniref:Uncharacterized protein n=1 Tax=Actinomadura rubrisoli TaxID=2530368 RepID=A0A4R5BF22_9ACTN|nr:hypothetical protein [Actinomadura rubrisoli]TDD85158.1 hypothetical protein E1298_19045 [Actinomadura rubrisoli]